MSGVEEAALASAIASSAAAAPAAAAGTAAAAGAGAGALGAGALGAGAAGAGMLGAEAGLAGAGAAEGGMLGAGAAPGVGMFVTPPIAPWAAAAPLDGVLGGTTMAYGSPAALAESAAAAGEAPGLLAQAGGYAKTAAKAASTYSAVNGAMGGGQPQRQAPQGRPIFQGDASSIAAPAMSPQAQSPLMQSGGNAGGMLRAIAQQRLGKRF